ncbi:MAG: response regulator transcription factor [Anaerolineaceae bacterium]
MSTSILIVDDQILFREALRTLLETQEDFAIIGEAANGNEAIAMTQEFSPEVILMDLRMPEMDGVKAIEIIHAAYPEIRIIMLTTFDEDEALFKGLKAGAVGYLLKDMKSEQLFTSIRTAARGEYILAPSAMSKLVEKVTQIEASKNREPDTSLIEPLSQREIEVLSLIAIGFSNKEIALKLVISEGTAKNHVSSILSKLGARDRLQAVIKARECGIL